MRSSHLSDDRLIEVCLDEAPFAAERQHLDGCRSCAERHASLAQMLADVASVATAEADAAFDADRLARQRTRILQHLAHDGRPGRVITFPASHANGPSFRARPGTRWIAGAAAAGLLIGVLAGHLAHVVPGQRRLVPVQMSVQPAAAGLQAVSTTMSEEELLGLLEVAIEGTGGASLRPLDDLTPRPLDDLTPRVWDVAAQ